tara:strand:+ start:197 stop:442 length:246 start_codon:yes stop_codon:yes gene_type:complete
MEQQVALVVVEVAKLILVQELQEIHHLQLQLKEMMVVQEVIVLQLMAQAVVEEPQAQVAMEALVIQVMEVQVQHQKLQQVL